MSRLFVFPIILVVALGVAGCTSSRSTIYQVSKHGYLDPETAGIEIEKFDIENISFVTAIGYLQLLINQKISDGKQIEFLFEIDPKNSHTRLKWVIKKLKGNTEISLEGDYEKMDFIVGEIFREIQKNPITINRESISVISLLNLICNHFGLKFKQLNEKQILLYSDRYKGESKAENSDEWIYGGSLHKIMLQINRIVVRDGGIRRDKIVDKYPILFEIKDPKEIQLFAENFNLYNYQLYSSCDCRGWPVIDFYKGKERIARIAIKHCGAVWWKKLPSEADLTRGTKKWLKTWFIEHGIPASRLK